MRLITEVLADIHGGRSIEEASEALCDVVRAVEATGKPGSVSLTVKVEPPKKGVGKIVRAEVSCKKPLADVHPAVMLDDEYGDLMPMPGPLANGSTPKPRAHKD